jgi:hypothetical protein
MEEACEHGKKIADKRISVPWLAEQILASQKGLSSMCLVLLVVLIENLGRGHSHFKEYDQMFKRLVASEINSPFGEERS